MKSTRQAPSETRSAPRKRSSSDVPKGPVEDPLHIADDAFQRTVDGSDEAYATTDGQARGLAAGECPEEALHRAFGSPNNAYDTPDGQVAQLTATEAPKDGEAANDRERANDGEGADGEDGEDAVTAISPMRKYRQTTRNGKGRTSFLQCCLTRPGR